MAFMKSANYRRMPVVNRSISKHGEDVIGVLNGWDMRALTALIAMCAVETFEEIDENLRLTGKLAIWDLSLED